MLPRIRVKGATIVSMDPTLGIIESGDLLIDGGKIIAVGRNVGSWAVIEIDGRGMIAMPGFINGHIHLWQEHCGVLPQTGRWTTILAC
jgi:5-methylthioadenosine/S-adenosylhomocysteine deaminase